MTRVAELASVAVDSLIDSYRTQIKTLMPVYNVKGNWGGFGGAKGDGVTDDTAAIQAAIDAGHSVYLPEGTYLYSTLNINKDIVFFSHDKVVLKQISYAGNGISISGTSLKVTFHGIVFDGNNSAQALNSTNNIINCSAAGTAAEPFVLVIDECTFKNQAYSSIKFAGNLNATGQEYLFVRNSRFYGGNEGSGTIYDTRYITVLDGGTAWLEDNIFDLGGTPAGQGISGICLATTDTASPSWNTIKIEGNEFRNVGRNASNALGCVDFYVFGDKLSIKGNIFINSNAVPIKGKSNSRDVIISENQIAGVTQHISSPTMEMCGITISAATTPASYDNFIIKDNIIRDVHGHGVSVEGLSTDYINNLEIGGNILSNIDKRGIDIYYVNNCKSIDNILSSIGVPYSERVIGLTNCSGTFDIIGNIIDTGGNTGIYGETGISDIKLVVSRNTVKAAKRYGIYLKGVSSLRLENNHVLDTVLNGIQVGYHIENVSLLTALMNNLSSNNGTDAELLSLANLIDVGNTWFKNVSCRVYNNADQAIADITWTTLAFNSERFDSYGMHDPVTNNSRITIKVSGVYQITTTASLSNAAAPAAGAHCNVQLWKNGTVCIASHIHPIIANTSTSVQVTTETRLNSGDYIEVKVYQSSGGALNVIYLTGHEITPEFSVVKID